MNDLFTVCYINAGNRICEKIELEEVITLHKNLKYLKYNEYKIIGTDGEVILSVWGDESRHCVTHKEYHLIWEYPAWSIKHERP